MCFFCLAVNLLEVDDLNAVLNQSDELTEGMDLSDKSDSMKGLLNDIAEKRNIVLKLRK
ncbi:MAG: hypothetical protein MR277_01045 [Methanobrevibacter ruminantium]|uniref:hypothetical protein n=1 Tax=Methanobrevibacter ruminantium TaxID=83816 RepID=UPI0026F2BD21|nr:hypothetical protein [Methanobrevibacter ruminantium]MCI5736582.1 hypothetical protein [Methanobrevibacter ruminantium]